MIRPTYGSLATISNEKATISNSEAFAKASELLENLKDMFPVQ